MESIFDSEVETKQCEVEEFGSTTGTGMRWLVTLMIASASVTMQCLSWLCEVMGGP